MKLFHKRWDNSYPRIIFVQKYKGNDEGWHATVMVDVTDTEVIVNDPALKPSRHIGKDTFLYLWAGGKEKKFELVAVSDKKSDAYKCRVCGKPIPDYIICPKCKKKVPLEPKIILGCMDDKCPGRTWQLIYCPYCETTIN